MGEDAHPVRVVPARVTLVSPAILALRRFARFGSPVALDLDAGGLPMLTNKLIQAIEDQTDHIVTLVIEQIKGDPTLHEIGKLPRTDLAVWGRGVLRHVGSWLGQDEQIRLGQRYEELGRLRFLENIPLHECVKGVQLLKEQTIDFIRTRGFAQTSLEIYAEEELEHRLDRFFDFLVYHLVVGYERALSPTCRAHMTHA